MARLAAIWPELARDPGRYRRAARNRRALCRAISNGRRATSPRSAATRRCCCRRTSITPRSAACRREIRGKLAAARPATLGAAARISGVTPAALVALLQYVKRRPEPAPLVGAEPPLSRPLAPDEFAALTGVSRETLARLEAYAGLLTRWSARINLVAASTLADPWRRHFLDSAQLYPLIPSRRASLIDLGSGAGFPGLVLAIMGVPGSNWSKSDARKCAFLREAARLAGAAVTIRNARIEAVAGPSGRRRHRPRLRPARPASRLFSTVYRSRDVCLFPKGRAGRARIGRRAARTGTSMSRAIRAAPIRAASSYA